MDSQRFKEACKGKTYKNGGLNVKDLAYIALKKGINIDKVKRRKELIDALCKNKQVPMDNKLLENACKGKTKKNGGLNFDSLYKIAALHGYTGPKKRADTLRFLCKAVNEQPQKEETELPMLKKERREKMIKKIPELKEIYVLLLKAYGIPLTTEPMAQGGFADVYDIGNGKIVRIEMSDKHHDKGYSANDINAIIKQSDLDVLPKIYDYGFIKVDENKEEGMVHFTIMEKLDIEDWGDVIKKDKDYREKIIRSVDELLCAGFIHRDISMNNVVYSKGRVMFIDMEGSCNMTTMECHPPHRTPGYLPPEWSSLYKLDPLEMTVKTRSYFQVSDEKVKRQSKTISLKRNYKGYILKQSMIYSVGVLIYKLAGGRIPDVDPRKMPEKYRVMVHPILTDRILPLGQSTTTVLSTSSSSLA